MKDCKLRVQINRSAEDVFEFVLDPNNTPLWVESIVKEEVNENPVKIGTMYRNMNKDGIWSEHTVTKFNKDSVFEFVASDKNYHVKYSLTPLGSARCVLEYYEWVERGELAEPFTLRILEKLKYILETSKKS